MTALLRIAVLVLIVATLGLAWWPLVIVEAELTERLGGYETVGAGSWGLRLAYAAAFTVVVVAAAIRPTRWLSARLAGSKVGVGLPVVLMHLALYTPVWGWTAVGVANVYFDRADGLLVETRFVRVEKRSKGTDHWEFERADGGSWSFSELRPGRPEPGDRVVFIERRGALGLTYVSMR